MDSISILLNVHYFIEISFIVQLMELKWIWMELKQCYWPHLMISVRKICAKFDINKWKCWSQTSVSIWKFKYYNCNLKIMKFTLAFIAFCGLAVSWIFYIENEKRVYYIFAVQFQAISVALPEPFAEPEPQGCCGCCPSSSMMMMMTTTSAMTTSSMSGGMMQMMPMMMMSSCCGSSMGSSSGSKCKKSKKKCKKSSSSSSKCCSCCS